MKITAELKQNLFDDVRDALYEDLGDGDLTAALLPDDAKVDATVVTREPMTQSGRPWFDEVFLQLDPSIQISWSSNDGEQVSADSVICTLHGPAAAILSGERTALNFLQTLSGTATRTAELVGLVAGSGATILDTRKTIPGLRLAQKYAVRCGGGSNHRMGLFDAILIKENHILSCGGITAAIRAARKLHGDMPVEIEVESIDEMREALTANAERLLLDNFSTDELEHAVEINRTEGRPSAVLEASGGLTEEDLAAVAATGVDYISVGALTKNVRAIDMSMRFEMSV
jgi:nicotinate-nucleotide pyrophosphorylase (carboxylating)